MNQRTLIIAVAAVVGALVLGYALGLFGGAEVPTATTTPPAAGTTH